MFVGFQYGAFQFDFAIGAHPDTHDGGGHYAGRRKKRKVISNVEFIYEKARSLPRKETKELRDAIAEYVEPEIARVAAVPEFHKIDFSAIEANERAYEKFAAALERIERQLGIEQAEDDELLLIAIIACTIN